MTRKDFELIADTLRYCLKHCDSDQETKIVEWVAETFAASLHSTNPRFDAWRFMAAVRKCHE